MHSCLYSKVPTTTCAHASCCHICCAGPAWHVAADAQLVELTAAINMEQPTGSERVGRGVWGLSRGALKPIG